MTDCITNNRICVRVSGTYPGHRSHRGRRMGQWNQPLRDTYPVGASQYDRLRGSTPALEIVQDPLIILAAAFMYCVEFMTDKIPGVDTGWDVVHTFIRIPAGALLAFAALGDVAAATAVAAGILGGGISAATHATKSATRVLINTSPEPFSNWGASILEDLFVFAGLWAALQHPVLFLLAFAVFLLALCWLLPKLLSCASTVFRKLGNWLGLVRDAMPDREKNLKALADAGVLTDLEYRNARARLAAS